jgi:diguanylate cyclase
VQNASSLVVLAIVMAVVELIAGGAIGWWLRGSQEGAGKDAETNEEVLRARSALNKLHELAKSVAADVGEHSSRVQAMSDELSVQVEEGHLETTVLGTVAQIIEANERLQQQLKTAEQKLQEQAQQIEAHAADAMTDSLTGAPNRRMFDFELTQRVAEWRRKQTPFCLMMVDVDHFKRFNDAHGHLAGDEVLRGVARCLRETLRDMDIVARYGGEEFAVIMPSTTLNESKAGAVRACAAIEQRQFEFDGRSLKVTVSGGLAQAGDCDDESTLIKRADEALYAAKKTGRNRVWTHDGESISQVGEASGLAAIRVSDEDRGAPSDTNSLPSFVTAEIDGPRTDSQTGLPNRTAFCEEIRRRVAESRRYDSVLSLLLVKVDAFAGLQTKYGDTIVGLVLKTVSQFLTAGMREMDLVARYNVDEFGVLLPGTPLKQAIGVAERLRTAVARCPLRGKEFELRITVSAGLAEIAPADDSADLLKRAEVALRSSTKIGCDCTHFHNGKMVEQFAMAAEVPA